MSRFATKQELLDDIVKERGKLETLLDEIPEERKLDEVVDGMTVKDFIAHRTEWGRMAIRWYTEARAGEQPAVPTERYKWNQLKDLNAEIQRRFAEVPLERIEDEFAVVHDRLYRLIADATEEELFTKDYYSFTGKSDLATYMNSATASHYRSAYRHISKWWRVQIAAAS